MQDYPLLLHSNERLTFMTKIFKYLTPALCILALIAILSTAHAEEKPAAAPAQKPIEMQETGWTKRCQDKDKKQCEIFQLLAVKDSKARVAEFALGFPEEKNIGRGGVILPLGILLEDGVTLKIDEGKPYLFKVRYCANDGCVAFLKVDDTLLSSLQKGKQITLSMKSATGQNINLVLSLSGFGKALSDIR